MRIALNWLKKLVEVPKEVTDEELVRLSGARLVEVEGVIDERHKYDNIYVVRVAKAEKIPETHLTLCQIDVGGGELARKHGAGTDGLVQVVCGAPNVREGMLAVWIAPGAVVPASVHEDAPFVIGKRKMLKKYESNGMLAGADELDFDDKHEKIAEIDPAVAKPGDLLADVFDLRDQILDIENKSLTHRPDCFGIIGFAREVAGILGVRFIEPSVTDWLLSGRTQSRAAKPTMRKVIDAVVPAQESAVEPVAQKVVGSSALRIRIASPEICQRYSAVVLEKHGKLEGRYLTAEQILIAKAGMRPIDPIVDATNYLMLLTGQPLHAFDYDKFVKVGKSKRPEIGVRLAKAGEKLKLLDGKEITLEDFDIVITSGGVPVALAGAMGGESTEIDDQTRNIIIESATFSLFNLRKTQMAHGIFSEAITRFTKGQPPYQTMKVALGCAEKLKQGYKVTAVADEWVGLEQKAARAGTGKAESLPNAVVKNTTDKARSASKSAAETTEKVGSLQDCVVKITTDQVNSLLGTDYSAAKITRTLSNVGFVITAEAGRAELSVRVPAWRTDIHLREDVIEEVGRLLGYDNIAPVLPLHQTAARNSRLDLKREIREMLRRLGANEVLTYSFVAGKLLEKAGLDPKNSYRIVNSISPELQYIRQSIVPSLLEKAYWNQKIPFDQFALFEMNKVYQKEWGRDAEGVPVEKSRLGCVIAERRGAKGVGGSAKGAAAGVSARSAAYYKAKKFAERLLEEMGVEVEFRPLSARTQAAAWGRPFEPKRAAELVTKTGEVLGVVGEFRNAVRNEFKLAEFLAGFELDLEILAANKGAQREIYLGETEKRDLTVTTEKSYGEVVAAIRKVLARHRVTARMTPIGIYQPAGKQTRNVSVHLEFQGKAPAELMQELEKI